VPSPAVLAIFACFALACGSPRSASAPHDDDELPDPKPPTDLPDDPGKPFEEGDRPLVDPAREMAPAPRSSAPSASSAAKSPKR
jgi:hypothetical protein